METYSGIPARDLARARHFYTDVFGMEPVEERTEGLLYRTPKGAAIMIYETDNAGSAANTAIGFDTDDIEAEVAVLRGLGVTFEDYDFPGLKTENGIATTNEDRAAWYGHRGQHHLRVTDQPGGGPSAARAGRVAIRQLMPARTAADPAGRVAASLCADLENDLSWGHGEFRRLA
ncbi:VOC family protein [Cryobacterium serini]|uniref:VOC family protein n=1 Tax=Cryobacterium serini TaxID=1259201 RepID=UPI0030BA217C